MRITNASLAEVRLALNEAYQIQKTAFGINLTQYTSDRFTKSQKPLYSLGFWLLIFPF